MESPALLMFVQTEKSFLPGRGGAVVDGGPGAELRVATHRTAFPPALAPPGPHNLLQGITNAKSADTAEKFACGLRQKEISQLIFRMFFTLFQPFIVFSTSLTLFFGNEIRFSTLLSLLVVNRSVVVGEDQLAYFFLPRATGKLLIAHLEQHGG